MEFEIIERITDIKIIAVGKSVRELKRLRKFYGGHRWKKLKGIASVRFPNGTIHS